MTVKEMKKLLERCNDDAEIVLMTAKLGDIKIAYGEYAGSEKRLLLVAQAQVSNPDI